MPDNSRKIITKNKKAWHDFFIGDTLETGISLAGTEVKSIRAGNVNLKDSYCIVKNGELLIRGMHISPYEKGNIFNKDPLRDKKLLAHKAEIRKLEAAKALDGMALIPLQVYLKRGRVKVEIGVAKGKKMYDKREDMAKRSAERDIEQAMKNRARE